MKFPTRINSNRGGTRAARERREPGIGGLAAIGLTTSDVMRAMAVTFTLNALFVLISPMFGLALFANREIRGLAAFALACAVVWHLMSKRNLSSLWLHVPTAASYMIYVGGGWAIGDARGAFAIILVSAAIATATMMSNPSFWIYPPLAFLAILAGVDPQAEPFYLVRVATLSLILVLMVTVATVNRRAQATLVERNRRLVDIDPLTGIGNVRAMRERIKREARQADESRHQLAIVSLDIAGFTAVNLHCGRSTGDEMLRQIAESISQKIEPADLVVRVRADGFAVIVLLDGVRDVHAIKIEIANAVARIGRKLAPSLRPVATLAHVVRRANEPADLLMHRAIDNHIAAREKRGQTGWHDEGALGADVVIGVSSDAGYSPAREDAAPEAPADTRNPWLMAVATTAISGALPLAAGLSGAEAFGSLTGQLAALALLALACLGSGMTRDGQQHRLLLQAYMCCSLALTTTVIAAAGDGGAAMLDFYLLPALFLMYSATPHDRTAWVMSGVLIGSSMALFAYFLIRSGYAYDGERMFITLQMLLVDGSVFARQESRIRRLQQKGDALLGVDSHTGLANLRRLRERIDGEIARRGLIGGSFGVVVFELEDELKAAVPGSAARAGDPHLIAAARVIGASTPRGALGARRGEAEFAIVAPIDSLPELRDLAGQTARSIARHHDRATSMPVSWGCAVWRPGESRHDLLRRADNALKRNRSAARPAGEPEGEDESSRGVFVGVA